MRIISWKSNDNVEKVTTESPVICDPFLYDPHQMLSGSFLGRNPSFIRLYITSRHNRGGGARAPFIPIKDAQQRFEAQKTQPPSFENTWIFRVVQLIERSCFTVMQL